MKSLPFRVHILGHDFNSHGKNVAAVSGQLDMVATAIKRLSSKSHESLATMG